MDIRSDKHLANQREENFASDHVFGQFFSSKSGFVEDAVDGLSSPRAASTSRLEDMAALFENILQKERGVAALVGRPDDVALVVSASRHVVEMNDAAATFAAGTNFLAIKMEMLSLNDPEADRWLGQALSALSRSIDGEPVTRILRSRDDMVQLAVFELPRRHETSPLSLPPLFLLLFRELTGRSESRSLKDMADAFGLTMAEIRLCHEFLNNRSLQQVADLFELSLGTVRQRLKVIFQKTGTRRQSELMSLLKRFL